jgi:hypothetical protein
VQTFEPNAFMFLSGFILSPPDNGSAHKGVRSSRMGRHRLCRIWARVSWSGLVCRGVASYSEDKKRRSKMPVDGFLRYRQGDLIPKEFSILRPRGFFSRIYNTQNTGTYVRVKFICTAESLR